VIIRRLVLVFSIVVCGSLALATAAFSAGGGFGPGQTIFSNTNANAFFGGGKGGPPEGFFVYVNQGLNSFEPEDGGVTTVTRNTIVQLTVYTAGGVGGGCYVIPDADFVVSRNVQSATLNTTLTTANMCKGKGAPAIGGAGVAPLAGGGILPPPTVLPPSITLNVTWTGNGATTTERTQSTLTCLDYSSESSRTARSTIGTATGTISMFTSSYTAPYSFVGSIDGTIEVSGYLSPSCPFMKG
jgi:hypothetical protein